MDKLGRVRSKFGWVTFPVLDQATHFAAFWKGLQIRGPMPGCKMYNRPRLTRNGQKSFDCSQKVMNEVKDDLFMFKDWPPSSLVYLLHIAIIIGTPVFKLLETKIR